MPEVAMTTDDLAKAIGKTVLNLLEKMEIYECPAAVFHLDIAGKPVTIEITTGALAVQVSERALATRVVTFKPQFGELL